MCRLSSTCTPARLPAVTGPATSPPNTCVSTRLTALDSGHAHPFEAHPRMVTAQRSLHHGGLGADGHPLISALGEDIHPHPSAAAVFSVGHALFGVTPLYHGNLAQDLNVHGSELEGLELGLPGLHICHVALLRGLLAIVAEARPIVGEDLTELFGIAGLHGIRPIMFELLD